MPPSNTINARPRFELVITTLSTVTRRTALELPSQNFSALEAEESLQLVTVTFSVGSAGPQMFDDHRTIASSPVSMVELATRTSWQPSGSNPSAQTPSLALE